MSRFFSKIVLLISLAIMPSVYADSSSVDEKTHQEGESSSPELRFSNSAVNKFLTNDFYGCIVDLNQAIALNPTRCSAVMLRARCKGKLNDWEGAVADADMAIRIAERQKDDMLSVYKVNRTTLLTDKTNYFNELERQRQEAAQMAIRQAQYDEDAAYEREKADVIRRMNSEARDTEARSNEQSQPSFWDRNAATLGNNLKVMQEGDAARRNADYRLQNNCSGANCVNR